MRLLGSSGRATITHLNFPEFRLEVVEDLTIPNDGSGLLTTGAASYALAHLVYHSKELRERTAQRRSLKTSAAETKPTPHSGCGPLSLCCQSAAQAVPLLASNNLVLRAMHRRDALTCIQTSVAIPDTFVQRLRWVLIRNGNTRKRLNKLLQIAFAAACVLPQSRPVRHAANTSAVWARLPHKRDVT